MYSQAVRNQSLDPAVERQAIPPTSHPIAQSSKSGLLPTAPSVPWQEQLRFITGGITDNLLMLDILAEYIIEYSIPAIYLYLIYIAISILYLYYELMIRYGLFFYVHSTFKIVLHSLNDYL